MSPLTGLSEKAPRPPTPSDVGYVVTPLRGCHLDRIRPIAVLAEDRFTVNWRFVRLVACFALANIEHRVREKRNGTV